MIAGSVHYVFLLKKEAQPCEVGIMTGLPDTCCWIDVPYTRKINCEDKS